MTSGFGDSLDRRLSLDAQNRTADQDSRTEQANAARAATHLDDLLQECAAELSKRLTPTKVQVSPRISWRHPAQWSPAGFDLDRRRPRTNLKLGIVYSESPRTVLLPTGQIWSWSSQTRGEHINIHQRFSMFSPIRLLKTTFRPDYKTGELLAHVQINLDDPDELKDPREAVVELAADIINMHEM